LSQHFSKLGWRKAVEEAAHYTLQVLAETKNSKRWDKGGVARAQKKLFYESMLNNNLSDDAILAITKAGPAPPPTLSAAMSRTRAERMRAIVKDLIAHYDHVGSAILTGLLQSIKDDDQYGDDYSTWECALRRVGTEIKASGSEALWLLRSSPAPNPDPLSVTGAANIVAILSRSQAEGGNVNKASTSCYLASYSTKWAFVSWEPGKALRSIEVERLVRNLLVDFEARRPRIEESERFFQSRRKKNGPEERSVGEGAPLEDSTNAAGETKKRCD
jgi:hypothetical protein